MLLKQILKEQVLPFYISRINNMKKHGATQELSSIKVNNFLNGLHHSIILFHHTSQVDPLNGVQIYGYSFNDIQSKLIKEKNYSQPSIEAVFWLLLIGKLPNANEIEDLKKKINNNVYLPSKFYNFLKDLPEELSPMSLFSMSLIYLGKDSLFLKKMKSAKKNELWELIFEDSLDLLAKIPLIILEICKKRRINYQEFKQTEDLDWCSRISTPLNIPSDVFRLFCLLHIDHEGGNVSTHTSKLVASALSDPYLAFSAGVNGLAGPLHGLANRNVVEFLLELEREVFNDFDNETVLMSNVKKNVEKRLYNKISIPGFGHSLLRIPDPRYLIFKEWARENIKTLSNIIKLTWICGDLVPEILKKKEKVKNPYPNIDLHSGSLLYHFGMKDYEMYPVFFAAARSFGCLANIILDRAVRFPLEYPLSMNLSTLENKISKL